MQLAQGFAPATKMWGTTSRLTLDAPGPYGLPCYNRVMPRVAEWNPLPPDVLSPWAKLVGLPTRHKLCLFGLFVIACIWCRVIGGGFVVMFAVQGIVHGYGYLQTRIPSELLPRQDDPSPVAQFAVRVGLRQRGVEYGTDQGFLSFVDGWLHFDGLRTSFSLKAADVLGVLSNAQRTTRSVHLPVNSLPVEVSVLPCHDPQQKQCDGVLKLLDDWFGEKVECSGESVLPPCTVSLERLPHIGRFVLANAALVAVGVSTFPVIHSIMGRLYLGAMILVGLFGLVCVLPHWRGMRRIRRGQQIPKHVFTADGDLLVLFGLRPSMDPFDVAERALATGASELKP